MITLALRFSDHFAPSCGTIKAHKEIIDQLGFVWFGKMGASISHRSAMQIMDNEEPKILLIHSGKPNRYWAYVKDIQWETPLIEEIPEYYRDRVNACKTWFKVDAIEDAPKQIMSSCTVVSSGAPLADTSKHSLNSFFRIFYNEEESRKKEKDGSENG